MEHSMGCNALVLVGKSFFEPMVYSYATRYFSNIFGHFEAVFHFEVSQWENKKENLVQCFDKLILLSDIDLDLQDSKRVHYFFMSPNTSLELLNLKQDNQKQNPTFIYPISMDSQSAELLLKPHLDSLRLRVVRLPFFQIVEPLMVEGGDNHSLQQLDKIVREFFDNKIIVTKHLPTTIIERLMEKNKIVATAESCTGGLLASFLTQQSGASNIFYGGVVSYANIIKETWLKVSRDNLETFGAVSSEVVSQMLSGILQLSGADIALATSGIAGPLGGSTQKPIGTVYIGVRKKEGEEIVERLQFYGDRIFIQKQATLYAYVLLLRVLD